MKKMRYKSKFKNYFVLLIIGILTANTFMGVFVLRNTANSKSEGINPITSSGTFTVTPASSFGAFGAEGSVVDENEYLEWSISTTTGPGLTFYMMNNTELMAYAALPFSSRTRGNFAYTALLSDEEASASGTFYPPYLDDHWFFLGTNHYTGIDCSVDFVTSWNDDFITVDEPTNSRSWEENTDHYINWIWGGDFSLVDIDLYHDGNFVRNIVTNAQNNGSYFWRVPADISLFDDLYQVNITNADFNGTWGISDSYFEITEERSISITKPSTSNWWETDTSEYINWTSTGAISNVKIELYNSDAFVMEITPNTPNAGDYFWAIPSGLDESDQYQIKISDESDPSVYNFSEYFRIFNFTITITNPDSESVWEIDTSEYINWTSTGVISNVKVELYNNDTFVMEITPNTPNAGDYFWAIPSGLDDSDQYQIKISDESNPFVYNFSMYFTIEDTTNPVVTFRTANHTVEAGYIGALLWWTVTDANPDTYTVELRGTGLIEGPTTWTSGISINYSIPTGFGAGSYIYTANFTDISGNFSTASINFTVIDTSNPVITISPFDSNVGEGYSGQSLSWTALDFSPNTYTIELQGTGIIAGPTVWSSGAAITYNIPDSFSVGSYIYTINITDDSGNFVTDSINFTVEDTTSPVIISSPSDLTLEVGYSGQSLSWTVTDVNPGTYEIERQGLGVIAGAFAWTSGNPITFNIQDGLAAGVYVYTVTFTDEYNNFISDTVTVTINSGSSPPPTEGTVPFGNFFLIFIGLSVICLIFAIKRQIIRASKK